MPENILHQPPVIHARYICGEQFNFVILPATRHIRNLEINIKWMGDLLKHHLRWAAVLVSGLVSKADANSFNIVRCRYFHPDNRGAVGHTEHGKVNLSVACLADGCIQIGAYFKPRVRRFVEFVAHALNAKCLRESHVLTLHMLQSGFNYSNASLFHAADFGGVE